MTVLAYIKDDNLINQAKHEFNKTSAGEYLMINILDAFAKRRSPIYLDILKSLRKTYNRELIRFLMCS